ncbi:putative nucleosome assembly protein [Trichophaea hybrida]|nr:putative nucleosome assembly protein [Trichophaea hybrida]
MSEQPIKNKKVDSLAGAPTPQNTPSSTAPISSHAQQPNVSTIEEEKLDRAAAASIFASNPALVSMIEGKLGKLVGRSSGYIESLPTPVRRRITGLRGVQKEHSKLEAQFQEEVLQLEKKYFAKFTPLYEKRAKIVNGLEEPTEEEVVAGKEDEDSDTEDAKKKEESTETMTGIPEFWLSSMKNNALLAETITERDEAALKHLTDIRLSYLDTPGFKLHFVFANNEFFTNKEITKTYYYQDENGYGGDFIYDHAEGDKINWKDGKDLTVRIESKKQRNKNTKQTRVVKRTVPTENEEDQDDIEDRLELDYQLGEDIKEKLIPRAIDWFTGEARQFEGMGGDMEGEFEDDDDEEDEDLSDDDRDEDDEESDDENNGTKPKHEAAECKQS